MDGVRLPLGQLWTRVSSLHDARMLCLRHADQEPSNDDRIEAPLWSGPSPTDYARLLRRWVGTRQPPVRRLLEGEALRRPLQRTLEHFQPDVVHMFTPHVLTLVEVASSPCVITGMDAEHLNIDARAQHSNVPARWLMTQYGRWVLAMQAQYYPLFDRVIMVTNEDRQEIERIAPTAKVQVIPNGVDVEVFADARARVPASEQPKIAFHGVLSYPPNVAAATYLATKVLPAVREAIPEATVELGGRSPTAAVLALGELPGVTVTGDVRCMPDWLARSNVYACMMQSGTGIKNKALEAMASGLPCVLTPLAGRGLQVKAGQDVLIARNAREAAEQIVRILRDRSLAEKLRRSALNLLREKYTWDSFAANYCALYKSVRGEYAYDRGKTDK